MTRARPFLQPRAPLRRVQPSRCFRGLQYGKGPTDFGFPCHGVLQGAATQAWGWAARAWAEHDDCPRTSFALASDIPGVVLGASCRASCPGMSAAEEYAGVAGVWLLGGCSGSLQSGVRGVCAGRSESRRERAGDPADVTLVPWLLPRPPLLRSAASAGLSLGAVGRFGLGVEGV